MTDTKVTTTTDKTDGKQYAEFSHTFNDPWAAEEVTVTVRLARPTVPQIKIMQRAAAKDPATAGRNLLVEIVHPDDKAKLLNDIDAYPGLVTTFSGAVIKAIGITADLGN